jgi:hypothetical protein
LYLAATAWATHEVRPLWMGGSTDPTYPYILNSLLVAEGRPPAQATHPGTPLQVLGAVVLRVAHGLSDSPLDLQRHVLTDPEYFTDAFRATLVALITVGTIAQGLAALHLTGSVLCAMAAQAAPLASVWGVRSSILVMAEPLILALGFAASATVLRSLRRGPDATWAEAALLGALIGIAVATKVMYVSLALLPSSGCGARGHGSWRWRRWRRRSLWAWPDLEEAPRARGLALRRRQSHGSLGSRTLGLHHRGVTSAGPPRDRRRRSAHPCRHCPRGGCRRALPVGRARRTGSPALRLGGGRHGAPHAPARARSSRRTPPTITSRS